MNSIKKQMDSISLISVGQKKNIRKWILSLSRSNWSSYYLDLNAYNYYQDAVLLRQCHHKSLRPPFVAAPRSVSPSPSKLSVHVRLNIKLRRLIVLYPVISSRCKRLIVKEKKNQQCRCCIINAKSKKEKKERDAWEGVYERERKSDQDSVQVNIKRFSACPSANRAMKDREPL